MRFAARRALFGLLVLLPAGYSTGLGAAVPAPAGPAARTDGTAGERLFDRVVAKVDDDPILLSDLERAIGLGLVAPRPQESDGAFRRRVLDLLVEQRLRYHEIERYGFRDVSVQAIEEQVERLRSRFPDDGAFERRLADLKLDPRELRQLLGRQLLTLAYVEERLGPRVFVGLDEIRRYYDDTFAPALRARGEALPPLESVREEIRTLLKEKRLNEEIERWTTELRREADVTDLLDEKPLVPLPPLVPAGRP